MISIGKRRREKKEGGVRKEGCREVKKETGREGEYNLVWWENSGILDTMAHP